MKFPVFASVTLTMLALGAIMPVFYFPGAVSLGILNSSGRKREFLALLASSTAIVVITAAPSGFLIFVSAASGCIAAGLLKNPANYFRKLFMGFFSAVFAMLAAGEMFSLVSDAGVFRGLSKIFLFSLSGSAAIIANPQAAAAVAEKAFRIIPAMALIMLTAGYFLNLIFIGFITGRKTAFDVSAKGVPVSIYVLSFALAFQAAAQKYFFVSYLSENILTVAVFFFFVSGCGIIWAWLRSAGAGPFLRTAVTASFAFLWPAAAAIGVMSRWVKFKKHKKIEG
ncbi:hypothetical protein KJ633_02025 [bacterium]|nr:hypothetical protein [bacterium]MBU4134001.1 hypothetical protein [bacterium]